MKYLFFSSSVLTDIPSLLCQGLQFNTLLNGFKGSNDVSVNIFNTFIQHMLKLFHVDYIVVEKHWACWRKKKRLWRMKTLKTEIWCFKQNICLNSLLNRAYKCTTLFLPFLFFLLASENLQRLTELINWGDIVGNSVFYRLSKNGG